MRELVAVDWGTSRLRAALIGTGGEVVASRASDDGILKVPAGGFDAVFARICGDWMQGGDRLCLMSGMVGSRNGWREAAYAPCPAGFDDLPAHLLWLEPGRHAIVPGLRCEHDGMPDLMRGEEVQVFGALALLGLQDATVVLPGTHSKWCEVRGGRIERFRTCLSGEAYALLREHSILGRGVPGPGATGSPGETGFDRGAFVEGLAQARRSGSLLASAFSARSRVLMQQLAPAAVPDYLSGLVIGEELRVGLGWLAASPAQPVAVVGAPGLTALYALALELELASEAAGPRRTVHCVGDEATWHGLIGLARAV